MGSVLIVDDDERTTASLARSLRADWRVFTATSAKTGLAIAYEHKPNIAIVDLRLGADSGLNVVRALKSELPATRIAVLSGYLSIDVTVAAVKAGADVVVSKPTTARDLLRRVTDNTNVALASPGLSGRAAMRSTAESIDTPSLAQVEAEHIARVLKDCSGNISEAARRLGIYRSSLQRKLKKRPTLPIND